MSKWHCDFKGFQQFVRLTVAPLKLAPNVPFRFLELGVRCSCCARVACVFGACCTNAHSSTAVLQLCASPLLLPPLPVVPASRSRHVAVDAFPQVGVGAFSRVLLHDFPASSMIGVDHASKAVAIASAVLPRNRTTVLVADMAALPASLAHFDHVLSPGSLCYLRSLSAVRAAIAAYISILRPSGGFCASMLPVSWEERGSCSTYIPESFWTDLPDFCLVSSESMEEWPVSGGGRYSVCGRKC